MPAYVYYISLTQINVQAPDLGTGSVSVTVTNANGTSNAMSVTADGFAPAFFEAGKYAIATHIDGTLVAPAGAFPGSSPAKPGETVTLWGTGFGPVTPSAPSGDTPLSVNGGAVAHATAPPNVTIGSVPAAMVAAVSGCGDRAGERSQRRSIDRRDGERRAVAYRWGLLQRAVTQ
jgi:uncharacterized protein (TIGR03437 family)